MDNFGLHFQKLSFENVKDVRFQSTMRFFFFSLFENAQLYMLNHDFKGIETAMLSKV